MNNKLSDQKSQPYQKGTPPLNSEEIKGLLTEINPDWKVNSEQNRLSRTFNFQNYYETMAFVNALAYISHREDHHPDLEVSYNRCTAHYNTHTVCGLSKNDFICAAKIDELLG